MTASSYELLRHMTRGDFAVLGFWFVSCIIFTCGCQPIPWLTCGREKKRDPLFYTGIVLISIGGLLVVCYFNRDTCFPCRSRRASAKPSDSVETPPTPPPDPETETEAEAEAEEPGFMGKLSSFLFGEEEPAVESEGVVVEAEAMREQEELEPER